MKCTKREKEQGLPSPYARCGVLGRTAAGRAGPHVPMLYPMQPDRGQILRRLQNLQKTCFPFSPTKKLKSVIGEELRGKDTTGLYARHSAARAKPYASPGPRIHRPEGTASRFCAGQTETSGLVNSHSRFFGSVILISEQNCYFTWSWWVR